MVKYYNFYSTSFRKNYNILLKPFVCVGGQEEERLAHKVVLGFLRGFKRLVGIIYQEHNKKPSEGLRMAINLINFSCSLIN